MKKIKDASFKHLFVVIDAFGVDEFLVKCILLKLSRHEFGDRILLVSDL